MRENVSTPKPESAIFFTNSNIPHLLQCRKTAPKPSDNLDNDCDGIVDEEVIDGLDNDGDGFVDEDFIQVI